MKGKNLGNPEVCKNYGDVGNAEVCKNDSDIMCASYT